jgi:hypothetical protein
MINILKVGAEGYGSEQSRPHLIYLNTFSERILRIYQIFLSYCTAPVIALLPFLVFSRRYLRVVLPAGLALLLLTIPYINSPGLKYYWFLPAFNLLRFLAFMGIAGFFSTLMEMNLIRRNKILARSVNSILIAAFVLYALFNILPVNYKYYLNQYKWSKTNTELSLQYIQMNMLANKSIVIDGQRSQYMPKVYDRKDIVSAKTISRTFMHQRSRNQFLNLLFERYLEDYYYDYIGIDTVLSVEFFRLNNPQYKDYKNKLSGKYFITSPFAYNTFIKRPDHRPEEHKFYTYILSQPVHRVFKTGLEHPIEIYYIDKADTSNEN